MTIDEQQEDEYFNRKIYINGKFMLDDKFDVDGGIKIDFAFFHGTMFEFETLLIKHKDIVDKYKLEYTFLTAEEIRLLELPTPNFKSINTNIAEEKRYLRTGYNTITSGTFKQY